MKRILLILVLVSSSLSAFSSFSFKFLSGKPLYPISLVDPVSSQTGIHYFYETKSEKANDIYLFNEDAVEFERYVYREWDDSFLHNVLLSAGGNFSLFRCSWDNFKIEFLGEAGLVSVFSLGSAAEMLGLDGTFYGAINACFFDTITLQAGFKHYSSHWGDEILMRSDEKRNNYKDGPISYSRWEYIRDNNFRIGISYSKSDRFNIRTSIEAPLILTQIRPYSDSPDYMIDPIYNISYKEKNPKKYAKRGDLGPSYFAFIIQSEVQYFHPISPSLDLFTGLHMKFHQDGITKNTIEPSDDDIFSWDNEFDVIIGLLIKDKEENYSLSFDLIFHHGRFPILNYKYKESQYISLGISIR